jgi:hypothetical protein
MEKVVDKRFHGKLKQDFYDYLANRMATVIRKHEDDAVPVVTGTFFQSF